VDSAAACANAATGADGCEYSASHAADRAHASSHKGDAADCRAVGYASEPGRTALGPRQYVSQRICEEE
jgi:hypothetical protein